MNVVLQLNYAENQNKDFNLEIDLILIRDEEEENRMCHTHMEPINSYNYTRA